MKAVLGRKADRSYGTEFKSNGRSDGPWVCWPMYSNPCGIKWAGGKCALLGLGAMAGRGACAAEALDCAFESCGLSILPAGWVWKTMGLKEPPWKALMGSLKTTRWL